MKHLKQRGSTLIVVLILLVMITLIGTMAIRQGIVSLHIATNSQARSLLIQSSDAMFFRTEDPAELTRNLLSQGLFGFIKANNNKGKELIFCFRPKVNSNFFDISKASVASWFSGSQPSFTELGIDGYCKVNDVNSFASSRNAVLTQVTVKLIDSSNDPFAYTQRGTDVQSAKIDDLARIVVYSTSIIPGLAQDATEGQMNDCFSKHMSNPVVPLDQESTLPSNSISRKSVTDCFSGLSVPYNTQVTEYNLMQLVTKCQVGTTTCTS